MPRQREWEVDPVALAEARELLEVRRPVEIRRVSATRINGRWGPRRDPRSGEIRHFIRIETHLDREQASRTLWHELTHASQFDRSVAEDTIESALSFARDCSIEKRLPHDARPSEIEANAARDFHDELPLTRAPNAIALRKWEAPR